jgi:hypothetical protein
MLALLAIVAKKGFQAMKRGSDKTKATAANSAKEKIESIALYVRFRGPIAVWLRQISEERQGMKLQPIIQEKLLAAMRAEQTSG